MGILSQQLAGYIPDIPSIKTKLIDPFPTLVPVVQCVERLTGNQVMGSIPIRDSEVFLFFFLKKEACVNTNIFYTI